MISYKFECNFVRSSLFTRRKPETRLRFYEVSLEDEGIRNGKLTSVYLFLYSEGFHSTIYRYTMLVNLFQTRSEDFYVKSFSVG